jgi:hypothetical protein
VAAHWLAVALDRMERGVVTGIDEVDPTGGTLTLRIDELERTIRGGAGRDGRLTMSELRPRSGPHAGDAMMMENLERPDAPPGFGKGGQVLQCPEFTYRSRLGSQADVRVYLPWVYRVEQAPGGP